VLEQPPAYPTAAGQQDVEQRSIRSRTSTATGPDSNEVRILEMLVGVHGSGHRAVMSPPPPGQAGGGAGEPAAQSLLNQLLEQLRDQELCTCRGRRDGDRVTAEVSLFFMV
jgi:hypothetical protein